MESHPNDYLMASFSHKKIRGMDSHGNEYNSIADFWSKELD